VRRSAVLLQDFQLNILFSFAHTSGCIFFFVKLIIQ
jgi:hypothetical protein